MSFYEKKKKKKEKMVSVYDRCILKKKIYGF